uniref:Chemokine interleukin-8-like domain-containing protein n=1 Tax=Myripristis murdjan TaxID=586833 RepID=A0A667YS24_9TELE
MVSCGNLMKSVMVAVILATLAGPGSLWSCCEKVSSKEITEPIIGYKLQEENLPCIKAVIFQTEKDQFCTYVGAPWVRAKADLSTLHTLACLLTCRIIF